MTSARRQRRATRTAMQLERPSKRRFRSSGLSLTFLSSSEFISNIISSIKYLSQVVFRGSRHGGGCGLGPYGGGRLHLRHVSRQTKPVERPVKRRDAEEKPPEPRKSPSEPSVDSGRRGLWLGWKRWAGMDRHLLRRSTK